MIQIMCSALAGFYSLFSGTEFIDQKSKSDDQVQKYD